LTLKNAPKFADPDHGHTGLVTQPVPLSAEHFDNWYANMASSGITDEIQQRHLGLPADLLSTSD
jgi:hypothetical protein